MAWLIKKRAMKQREAVTKATKRFLRQMEALRRQGAQATSTVVGSSLCPIEPISLTNVRTARQHLTWPYLGLDFFVCCCV